MLSFLTTYAVPIIGSAILAAFAKPDATKPPIWKRVVDSVVTTAPTTDVEPVEHSDKLAQLVSCARILAAAEPDYDVLVSITEAGGVDVRQPPRVKVVNAQSK